MKVTIIICDRCEKQLRNVERKENRLDVNLKFETPRNGWSLFKRRESLHLCPSCRSAFADWLGKRAETIRGLQGPATDEPDGEIPKKTDGAKQEETSRKATVKLT